MSAAPEPSPTLLLLSNSRNPAGEYLVDALPAIARFAAGRRKALFFAFAGVAMGWDDALDLARQALGPTGLELAGAHHYADVLQAIEEAELLLVGGGNTFRLLHEMRARGWLGPLGDAVRSGKPYAGWSAGSVLACPTICTTNDMPIIDPGGLSALDLVPFQINAHYTNARPTGHQGETRDQRIAEYLALNPAYPVLGLPEGNWLEAGAGALSLHGPHDSVLFLAGQEPRRCAAGPLSLA